LEESSPRKVIFITINSKGDDRGEEEIRNAWERVVKGVLAPGIEGVEKVTILPAPPSQSGEQRPAEARAPTESKLSLTIRREEALPPRFYYTVDDREWFEIPGERGKVWQLRFDPRDLGLGEGAIRVRVEFGDERVETWIRIKPAGKHVLEMAEP
jgi:hypothetical protein